MQMTVAVVGAGVVGAAVAGRLTEDGAAVTLIDPAPRSGASWVAGGMLAPVTEAWPGEEALLALGIESLRQWPEFAARLSEKGHDPRLRTDGTLVTAVDTADRAELANLAEFLATLDRKVDILTGRELRAIEPGLGPAVRTGLSVPGDLAVDNRKLLDALLATTGAKHIPVAATEIRPTEVRTTDRTIRADVIVVAAGAWSAGLHPALQSQVRPVKGEILRLRARPGSLPPPSHTVRGLVEGRHVYLVPRDDNGLVVGATQYEAGFEPDPRVGGVRDLLADAERLIPSVADYVLTEAAAGFRPGSPDNLPIVRWLEPGVLAATGHGRNGILLLPGTVARVAELIREAR
ncbi:MAG TPA: glycine oxidase ThiO [Pseudonocardiaceae bacterium]|jgi:glycine oxidase|nr:glycine oxidase ThiO [Pseudonocardiaceae bacterium]